MTECTLHTFDFQVAYAGSSAGRSAREPYFLIFVLINLSCILPRMSTTFFRPTEPALLGVDFRLRKIEIRRGSVEFWVYVAGGFTLIPHYANFVRSLELLVAQI